ncbi:MAG: hypothetical protein N2484_08245 [Clostridia bacterium]|nr:hypothetical protein [Clostridia bacterium]
MSNFLLLACKAQDENTEPGKNVFKVILNTLRRLRKGNPEEWLHTAELCKDSAVYAIRLPYEPEQLEKLSKGSIEKINRFINDLKSLHSIENIYIPESLSHIPWINVHQEQKIDGNGLYRSLIVKILEEIYSNYGMNIRDLDITIVHGMQDDFLFELVSRLANYVKYLTVISNSKERIEEQLNRFYSDTGLSIGITKDYKSGLRNVDVVINLGDLKEFILNSRINPKAIILNYGNLDISRVYSENPIINGIDVSLPAKVSEVLMQEVADQFNHLQLAEIILRNVEKSENIGEKEDLSSSSGDNLDKKFDDYGFKIKYFIGRREILKTAEIRIDLEKKGGNGNRRRKADEF